MEGLEIHMWLGPHAHGAHILMGKSGFKSIIGDHHLITIVIRDIRGGRLWENIRASRLTGIEVRGDFARL